MSEREVTLRAVRFVIDTVINDGLIDAFGVFEGIGNP